MFTITNIFHIAKILSNVAQYSANNSMLRYSILLLALTYSFGNVNFPSICWHHSLGCLPGKNNRMQRNQVIEAFYLI